MTENLDKQPDRSSLADLYPTAKTFEQRVADRDMSEARKQARRPKAVALTTSWRLYALLIGTFLAILLTPMLFALGPVAGVPMAFAVLLGLAGFGFWMVMSIARDFAAHGYNAGPLLAVYFLFFPAIVYGLGLALDPLNNRLTFTIAVTIVHIIVMYILMKLLGPRV